MKILIYYLGIFLLFHTWSGDLSSYKFIQISVENDSNIPDHEKENENVEIFSDLWCLHASEKIKYFADPSFFQKAINKIPDFKKNGWVQVVFDPPETCKRLQ